MTVEETAARCALNRIFGYSPSDAHAVLEAFGGSAVSAFRSSADSVFDRVGPYRGIAERLKQGEPDAARSELEMVSKLWGGTCTFVPFGSELYPHPLAQCADAPLGLYVRSSSALQQVFDDTPAVAVVGTRDVSPYGRHWCRKIVEELSLARVRPRIVSGLAFGTDIIAHVSALEYGLPTIAVLPCGIDAVYPSAHWRQAEKIAAAPGSALVSDYPPGTTPKAVNFLRRNRIIAGLSRCTVVVESKARGGSLITAQFAFDYDRDVYALPGRLDDVRSQGCNTLIRMHTATAIDTVESLSALLGLGQGSLRRRADLMTSLECRYGRTGDVQRLNRIKDLVMAVRGRRGIGAEDLSRALGIPYAETAALLNILESDGFICSDLLQRYSLND